MITLGGLGPLASVGAGAEGVPSERTGIWKVVGIELLESGSLTVEASFDWSTSPETAFGVVVHRGDGSVVTGAGSYHANGATISTNLLPGGVQLERHVAVGAVGGGMVMSGGSYPPGAYVVVAWVVSDTSGGLDLSAGGPVGATRLLWESEGRDVFLFTPADFDALASAGVSATTFVGAQAHLEGSARLAAEGPASGLFGSRAPYGECPLAASGPAGASWSGDEIAFGSFAAGEYELGFDGCVQAGLFASEPVAHGARWSPPPGVEVM